MGALIFAAVASKQGGAQPHTVKGGKIELASGVADKTTALPDEPPAHLPSKRRGLRYTSEADLTDTLTAAETAPLEQQKADHVRRLREKKQAQAPPAMCRQPAECRETSRAQPATSAEHLTQAFINLQLQHHSFITVCVPFLTLDLLTSSVISVYLFSLWTYRHALIYRLK